ncbi:ParA family protein [Mucilaginibacter rubeus]|uniref:ParA family protein n=1 Tax=Mucilaginibacter rubeus TaxID=2027860 RepID=A0AAE6JM19_9SPHI|nr:MULTISPECIES: ParA family protein [Mucilaginibacter]QEM07843.1 ParA family protein [Mucilaginibacter rubeus]QEM20295.1 ParA family protein [Mucilaginibacter gossypii]QTE42987.1 ParA family protein [Mucilaginibacter rubeus]QTE49588.1 ParA family protein [Mucilaginibacter rubeus]QTE54684.1 ParA family protein [Mucilaginibacter rubeus]
MNILIGNQKGGCGKSTIALLLANYLTMVKHQKVTLIDMDYQQSIAQKFEKAKVLENKPPYDVVAAQLAHYPVLQSAILQTPNEAVIIDLPGKLDDDGLLPVFGWADLLICPFSYDEFSFDSTVLFAIVLLKLNPEIPIIFIPNRVKANVRYETMQEVNKQLSKLGIMAPMIPDRIDFQRVTTFMTPLPVIPVILPVFDQIYRVIEEKLSMDANG